MSSNWIFLSHQLNAATPTYGDRGGFKLDSASRIADGATSNSMLLVLPNHVGTHIDCPRHFFDDGHTVTDVPASQWVFVSPLVLDIPKGPAEIITAADVKKALERFTPDRVNRAEALLVRTGFEKLRGTRDYWEKNPGVGADLGTWLRENVPHVRLLGLDTLSVTSWQHRELGRVAHRSLMSPQAPGRPLILLEDASFQGVNRALVQLVLLPLRVEGADGAPCTALGQLEL